MRQLLSCGALLMAAHFVFPASLVAFQGREQAYRLQSGDALEVQYRYTPEFNAKAVVQPDGQITIPIAGAVRVGGSTVEEARASIATKAGERLREPELVLLLTDFVKPSFTVAGEVSRPGRYDLRGSMSAIDAVAISGGIKDSSKHSQVLIVRRHNDEFADVRVFNLKHAMTGEGVQEDIRIQNGDLLIVPQNFVSKLERYVRWGQLYAGFSLFRR